MNVQHNLAVFNVPNFSKGGHSVFIYSDEGSSREWIEKNLYILKSGYSLVFRAVGLSDNIVDIASKVKGEKSCYFPGDEKKFFIKKFSEYFCVITQDNMIESVLNEWVSTIYEYRVVYILDSKKIDYFISVLKENVYSSKSILPNVMQYIEGYIENVQDAPDHDSYIVNLKSDLWEEIGIV